MDKLSVLLLHNTIAPYRLPLFEELAQRFDLEVAFCQPYKRERLWKTDLSRKRFKYHLLMSRTVSLGSKSMIISPALVRLLLSRTYDVYILAHGPGMLISLLITIAIARLKRRPIVFWSGSIATSGPNQPSGFIGSLRNLALRSVLYRWPHSYIAYGQRAADYLRGFDVPLARIFTGTQVLWPELVCKPMQSKADLGLDDRKVILCLSYLNQRKGIQYLIEAFHKLDRDDTTLVIAGDGPLRQSLENQAARARNIVFTGYIDAEVKASYYAASDLFVLPTTEDPWGWVINEAMYYGLPVIVSDAAGGAELIDGNGFVVKSCDSDSLCEAIQALLDDDELRSRMASRSLELSRQMDPNSVVDVFSVAIQQAQRGMESCR